MPKNKLNNALNAKQIKLLTKHSTKQKKALTIQ